MIAWMAALAAPGAHAQTVTFDLDAAKAQQYGLDTADIESTLGAAIGDQLNLVDPTTYLSHFADAAAVATKGMGVDYASNFEKFSVGGTLGTGVAGVPLSFARGQEELPEGGFSFMAALHAGVNLGVLTPGEKGPLEHVRLFVSGLGFNPPSSREFRGSMYNFGVHGQIKLFGPVDLKAAEWGGFDLTAGYEQSFYRLSLAQGLPLGAPLGPAELSWNAEGTYTISANAAAIPLELSTNFRVLVATVYVGGAYDLNTADAASEVGLAGPVDVTAQGTTENLGSASVSLAGSGLGDARVGRLFVGAQANLTVLKVYGQLNIGLNEAYGGFLGLRVAL